MRRRFSLRHFDESGGNDLPPPLDDYAVASARRR